MNSRRSFLTKMGAGVAGAVASTAAIAGARAVEHPDQNVLRDEMTLRALHQAYERALDKGLYDDVMAMFAADAQVVFNGGLFRQRAGIRRLYGERFAAGQTGRRMDEAPGFELAPQHRQERVEVSADRRTAQAVFPFSMQVGMPIDSDTSLASMARLHGEGVRTWWEGGVCRVSYRKTTADGQWQISRFEYDTVSRADYRHGRRSAQPIDVARLSRAFPQDIQGPDELV